MKASRLNTLPHRTTYADFGIFFAAANSVNSVDIDPYLFNFKTKRSFIGDEYLSRAVDPHSSANRPIVVIHLVDTPHDDDVVMLRLKDLEDLIERKTRVYMATKGLHGTGNAEQTGDS